MRIIIDNMLFGKGDDTLEYYHIFNTKSQDYNQQCYNHKLCGDDVMIGDVLILNLKLLYFSLFAIHLERADLDTPILLAILVIFFSSDNSYVCFYCINFKFHALINFF